MNTRNLLGIAFCCAFTALACGAMDEADPAADGISAAENVELQSLAQKQIAVPANVTAAQKLCNLPNGRKPPVNLGAPCGKCEKGIIQCNGTCSVLDPLTDPICAFCGGETLCNGTCSVQWGTHPEGSPGQPCSGGAGTIQCNGTCFIQ